MHDTLKDISKILFEKHLTLSCAESCTGGLLSSAFTDISGSSDFIKINFTTYSNEAKIKFLNVSKKTLEKYGAVSEQTSIEMAKGLLKYANIGISTTGIAGPTGESREKPIGLMYTTISTPQFTKTKKILLDSKIDRVTMKKLFVEEVLKFTLKELKENIK